MEKLLNCLKNSLSISSGVGLIEWDGIGTVRYAVSGDLWSSSESEFFKERDYDRCESKIEIIIDKAFVYKAEDDKIKAIVGVRFCLPDNVDVTRESVSRLLSKAEELATDIIRRRVERGARACRVTMIKGIDTVSLYFVYKAGAHSLISIRIYPPNSFEEGEDGGEKCPDWYVSLVTPLFDATISFSQQRGETCNANVTVASTIDCFSIDKVIDVLALSKLSLNLSKEKGDAAWRISVARNLISYTDLMESQCEYWSDELRRTLAGVSNLVFRMLRSEVLSGISMREISVEVNDESPTHPTVKFQFEVGRGDTVSLMNELVRRLYLALPRVLDKLVERYGPDGIKKLVNNMLNALAMLKIGGTYKALRHVIQNT